MADQTSPIIGKDVIESLTLGMYEDSRFIFREYVQNAADQIDKAEREGLLSTGAGQIHITINQKDGWVEIEDNATGIEASKVRPLLQNIAQSTKQRGVDKGFRGIGRLGGLAYCEELIFETSFRGETTKSILTWNATLLKDIINNRTTKEDAASVIQQVTNYYAADEASEAHYFKVFLKEVKNDTLLNKESIQEYLSLVAPIPFPTSFIFKSKIYEELKKDQVKLDEYKIYLNSEQLFKAYTTTIKKDETQGRVDEVIDVAFFKEYASDGKLLYWSWHSISEKNQSLNQINLARGFRLRKSNIQVGDGYTLQKHHREQRFHFYFFGEVYGVHPDLIPNSRRDYFIENSICLEFEDKLCSFFHTEIHRLCRAASDINSSARKLEDLDSFQNEFEAKSNTGFTDKAEQEEYQEKLNRKLEEAEKARAKINRIKNDLGEDTSQPLHKILKRVVKDGAGNGQVETLIINANSRPKFRTDNLGLSRHERKLVGRIFSIIRGVLDNQTSEELIQKIEEELR